jgi:hypothetical protein
MVKDFHTGTKVCIIVNEYMVDAPPVKIRTNSLFECIYFVVLGLRKLRNHAVIVHTHIEEN